MRINRGDTPQNNPTANLIVQWIDEWCALHREQLS